MSNNFNLYEKNRKQSKEELLENIQKSNIVRKYLENNIMSISKTPKDLLINGRKALTGVLINSKDKILMNTPPNIIRGICCELMFRYICIYYFTQNNINFYMKDNLILYNSFLKSSTQLDTVILTNNCILVVECKSLYGQSSIENGIITNKWNTNGKNYVNETKPWSQNSGHILTLKEELSKLGSIYNNIYYYNVVFLFGIGEIVKYIPENHKYLLVINNAINSLDSFVKNEKYYKMNNTELIDASKYLDKFTHSIYDEVSHVNNLQKVKGR